MCCKMVQQIGKDLVSCEQRGFCACVFLVLLKMVCAVWRGGEKGCGRKQYHDVVKDGGLDSENEESEAFSP